MLDIARERLARAELVPRAGANHAARSVSCSFSGVVTARSSTLRTRLPRPVTLLIVLTVVTSIAAAITPELYARLALIPALVWKGEVWRLVTWTLVESSPLALIFAVIAQYWFGGDLATAWGDRRFTRLVALVVLAAGGGTSLVSLASPDAAYYPHLAGWALGDALVIVWALTFPERQIRLYGMITVGGKQLAHGLVAITLLFAVFYGFIAFLPEIIAASIALLVTSRWWRTPRSRRFQVFQGGRHGGPFRN